MQRRSFIKKTVATLGVTAGVAGCSGGASNAIEILRHNGQVSQYGTVSVVGTAQNTSDSTVGYAQIEAKFLGPGGARLGTGLANISDLAPGRRWNFECVGIGVGGERVTDYEVSVA